MIVVGSMIGSGIFIVSADITRNVGSAGWLILVTLVVRGMAAAEVGIALLLISAGAFLIGIPWTIQSPNAGPHDLLSGTRVVPR